MKTSTMYTLSIITSNASERFLRFNSIAGAFRAMTAYATNHPDYRFRLVSFPAPAITL